MESNKIAILIEKYFEGETSIAQEKELRNYFSTQNVAPHFEQYKAIFGYFDLVKQQEFSKKIPPFKKRIKVMWLSIAASVVVLLGMVAFFMINNKQNHQEELGTYNNPEKAFVATQKALALLSNHVNVGIESVQYVQEYEEAKNKVFK